MRVLQLSLTSIALLLFVSCGEQTTQPNNPDLQEPTAVCPDLTAVTASGIPLDEIVLDGVPNDMEVILAEVRSPATGETIFTAVDTAPDGTLSVLVPLHPDLDPDGGPAEIVVGSATSSCEALSITVEPLPAAPGEFEESITAIASRVEEALTSEGNEVMDFYQDDLSSLPRHLLPYAAVHSLFAHPDRAESVLALATGSTTTIEGDEVDMELLDRIAARVGLRDHLANFPLLVPEDAAASILRNRVDAASSALQEEAVLSCPDGDFGLAWVADTEDLSNRMHEQWEAEAHLGGAAGKVHQDLATVTSMLATSSDPAVGGFAKGVTVVLNQSLTMQEAIQNLFPRDLEAELFLSQTAFNEDDPGPGQWTLVGIATSEPWNLNKKVFEAALKKGLGGASVGKQVLGEKAVKDPVLNQAASTIDDYVINKPTGAALDRMMTTIGADQDNVGFYVPAGCWDGPDDQGYDLSRGGRTEVEVIGDAVYIADFDDEGLYYPDEVGTATIQVTTASQAYGNNIYIERREVEVKPILVAVDPTSRLVEPGELVTFAARVRNANDQTVSWHTTAGYFDIETTSADGNNEAVLVTPTDEEQYPVRVTARSETKTGIRGKPDAPERSNFGLATIEVPLFMVAGPPCLEPGDTWTFEAIALDGSEVEVTWMADNGSFSSTSSGEYTAGSEGEATIIATSVMDEESTASVSLKIGACTCSFRAQMIGYNSADIRAQSTLPPDDFDPYLHAEADAVLNEAGDLESVRFEGPIFGTVFRGHFLRENWGPVPGGSTGRFDLKGVAGVFEVEPGSEEGHYFTVWSGPAWWEPAWEPLSLVIYAWEDDLVRGSVQGIVLDVEHFDFERPTFLRVDFLALTKVGATTYSSCNP